MTARPFDLEPERHPPSLRLLAVVGHQSDRLVIGLLGEHDISNAESLESLIADATALHDGDVVIDLSRVEFMSASTIHVIVRARERLGRQTRSITLRSPSPIARVLLDHCHIDYDHEPGRRQQSAVQHLSAAAFGNEPSLPKV